MRTLLATMLCLSALGLTGCRGGESEKPPVHLIHNMDTQEKFRPYRRDPTGLFADGRMMRMPVEGTVAQGQLDEDDVLHEGLDDKGQPSLKFPDSMKENGAVTDALRARGQARFNIYCLPCHGPKGDGTGVVAGVALDGGPRLTVKPANLTDQRVRDLPVGKLYAAIKYGVNNGNMGSYASQVPVEDRWAIIAWVRQLQRNVEPSQQDEGGTVVVVQAATSSSKEHGEQLFKAKGCNACHSLDGSRLVGPSFKGVWGRTEKLAGGGEITVDEAYVKESLLTPMAKVVDTFPPAMPPQVLNDVEIGSIILFLKEQK